MLIRLVRLTFKEDKVETFLENFHLNKTKIRSFPGCLHLEVWRDYHQPNIFMTCSHWESADDLESYRQSELFKGIWTVTKTFFADKPMAFSVNPVEEVKIS